MKSNISFVAPLSFHSLQLFSIIQLKNILIQKKINLVLNQYYKKLMNRKTHYFSFQVKHY